MNTLISTQLNPGDIRGRWTVVKDTHKRQSSSRLLLCLCSCGNVREVREQNIIRGLSKSCGCLSVDVGKSTRGIQKRRKNRIGDPIGDFTIVGFNVTKLGKSAGYFGQCANGHRIALSRNFINNPERATCWCSETNTFRRYRRKKGLTIKEIADTLCYGRSTIQSTETKPTVSSEYMLRAVADLLEIPSEELEEYIKIHHSRKEVPVYG